MRKGINISIALKRSRIFIFAIMIHLIFAISPNHSLANELHAFLWDSVNGMQDLGSLGVGRSRNYARDINDSGQVVGASAVPLPGAVWLLGSGLFGILLCVNFSKKNAGKLG